MASVLLRNGKLFDGVTKALRPGTDVLVVDGAIADVSDTPLKAPVGAIEVDVGGRTLLPGLIDAHVHVFAVNLVASRNESMPLTLMTARAVPRIRAMLDRGFTTVRDVGGGDVGIRDAVAQGYIPGPRLYVGGPAMTQTGGHGDHRRRTDDRYDIDHNSNAFVFFYRFADGPDEMRRVVRNELRKGADHIKVMASGGVGSPTDAIENIQFTREELEVAVFEAARRGKYVCAHTYTAEAIHHAVASGVRTVEHANFIDRKTADFVVEKGAYVVPTLVCYEETEKHGDRLGLSPYVMDKLRLVNRAGIEMLATCTDAGVKTGFGTDLMGEMEYAQSDEFAIRGRVQSPFDVLCSATSVNAEILQETGRLGVVAPGAHADLIVCDGDPTRDVALLADPHKNLRLIMKGGAFHKNELETRLA
ncbi:metal-dependent hydrolase family protein [Chelatococcus asaccharovorans]|uniref:Imidazolonepropionase-like amidohydrolase n=1 Tax=Chelatococcus asaccharovorans TaxID=28210 RepID=A0A2V3UDT4_9HYPH|nr:amidohydrolase family protein [Chelatococcus asaccharovorans]MBS7707000.1 amidohydrolase family protein [Chelatococcus asaccharovorans]PXW63180.1 imidazolonepropionase-like amidohydrolase [Chelatococcus asaccharovorans]